MMKQEPPADALRWATDHLDAATAVVAATGLREGGNPWLLRIELDGRFTEAVLKTAAPDAGPGLATEVAALRLAEERDVPAPRILAVDASGEQAGTPAVLETVVAGRSRIPLTPSTERLRNLGASAAVLHSIAADASPDLPLRTRPIPASDFVQDRREGRDHPTPLLTAADEQLSRLPVPSGMTVLVHGDLWQGNTMWDGDRVTGLLDWDMAGVGHYGVDLSSLRLDAALMFGQDAVEPVLAGWEERAGRPAEALAYWDVVAALNQPGDMAEFAPVIHDQGRPDLSPAVLNERRDTFLLSALDRL
jgi:aminoglycoside phosphotransferase (APT) family kinase protein